MSSSPEPDASEERPPRAGLSLPWDIVVAPARAFAKIATSPQWLPAYGVIVALSLASALFELPATLHVIALTKPAPGSMPPTPAEAATNARVLVASFLLTAAMLPLVIILLTATALTFFAGIRDPKRLGQYSNFVSLAAACGVIPALGDFTSSIGIRLHDPTSFHDLRSIATAVPITFAVFAAHGNDRQVDFLAHFGIFDIWANIVLAFGFAALGNVGLTTALIVAFSLDLALAFLY